MRHQWTDPDDLLLYRAEPGAIRRPLSREIWEGMIYTVLSREILRLAEEVERLKADRLALLKEQQSGYESTRDQAFLAERSRIRRELLEEIDDCAERIEGHLCGLPGCNLPHHVGLVVDVSMLKEALNRIAPEEG